ncbi:MAG: TlpA disulfide reductase family protein [Pseudomonadota bacterium]|nr:TlpA disulfide reductase family protein [Pseudomonadota bacterium]MDP1904580.1 TlpA disulfide reductase family protein [Pseudomonadota bacterium]MDP2353221.1 TlpA disulfide reductase family protein [Pseudomonadota bacterium]
MNWKITGFKHRGGLLGTLRFAQPTWLLLVGLLAVSGAMAEEPINFYAATTAAFAQPGGGSLKIDNLKGRPAVVNFWATWCPPCREELPLLVKVHARYTKKYGDKLGFLGLAVEDNVEFVGEYARAYGLEYPIAAGREPAIALMQALGNKQAGMPYTVVLDGDGRVVYAKRGLVKEKDLDRALAPLLRR